MKVDVIGSNSLLFANLPPASQVPGRTYRASDVGPAPGILLTSDGTKYRPAGGRQVIAMRTTNPVTVQDLAGAVAETIGPFPGGLVAVGQRLELKSNYSISGLGNGVRDVRFLVNTTDPNNFSAVASTATSNADLWGILYGVQEIGPSLSAVLGRRRNGGGLAVGSIGYGTFSIDLSSDWSAYIHLRSAAETAVNISSATWAGGIATFNTAADHTLAVGDKTVIAGVTPTGWNIPAGAIVLSVPTTTQFTVALAADPGTYSTGGTSSRISNMISQSYVLELVG